MDISSRNVPLPLRDGTQTLDARLDRLVQFDERSRNYPIRATIESDQPRTKWWRHTAKLNQRSEGACVGFAWAHELNTAPIEVEGMTDEYARGLYKRAQQIDPWPGEDYEGTSVLAGAQTVEERGFLDEYRWAFGIDDVILTLSWHGPVVLGVNWYYGMYFPDAGHYIRPGGQLVGGHAIMAIAYNHEHKVVYLLNSWGAGWGWNGLCRIKVADLATLLREDGEACVPVLRGEGLPEGPTEWSMGGHVDTRT